MAPKAPTVTIKSLQALLTQVGLATSGKKENLISRLSRDLKIHRLPICADPQENIRILSIDMGIKNLAFCVADVQVREPPLDERIMGEDRARTKMKIISWRRLDVVEEVSKLVSKRKEGELVDDNGEVEDPYTPSALSSAAYTLLAHTLLPYKPDIILIERQRWRSSNGVAIQQWTVRVNTLEGMLWAILTALRAQSTANEATSQRSMSQHLEYEIFGVDPKRVGNFWIGESTRGASLRMEKMSVEDELVVGPEGEIQDIIAKKDRPAPKKLSRGKAEKKAKIQLLRSWLMPDARSTMAQSPKEWQEKLDGMSPAIEFTFSSEAEATRAGLCSIEKVRGGRKTVGAGVPELKKLDDVTDCFLQAAAWVAWEVNRKKMVHDWDSEQGRLRGPAIEGGKKTEEAATGGKNKKATRTRALKGNGARMKSPSKP